MPHPYRRLRSAAAALGAATRARVPLAARTPPLTRLIEWAARVGYGARGFVYLSAGALTLLAANDRIGPAVGTGDAAGWLAGQPYGRAWLLALGVGLWAFVMWRVIQAVFDADHEGPGLRGWVARAGQALSALFYGLLASTVFEYLDEVGPVSSIAADQAEDAAENQEKAAWLMSLPFGETLLVLAGLAVLALGLVNLWRAATEDFGEALACSPSLCRRVTPLARAGYAARGVAWLPLSAFILMAGLRARPGEVTSFGQALNTLESQLPYGGWLLGLTGLGLMAFGAFAFVEARWRRIRPPRTLDAGIRTG